MSDYTNYADELLKDVEVTTPAEEVVAEEVVTEVEAPVEEAGTQVLEDGTTIVDHVVTAEDLANNPGEDLMVGDVVGLVANPDVFVE